MANNIIYYLYVFSSHGALVAPSTELWSAPAPLMLQQTFAGPWTQPIFYSLLTLLKATEKKKYIQAARTEVPWLFSWF